MTKTKFGSSFLVAALTLGAASTAFAGTESGSLTVTSVRATSDGNIVVFFDANACTPAPAKGTDTTVLPVPTGARPGKLDGADLMESVALAAMLSGHKVKVDAVDPGGESGYCQLNSIRIVQ